MMIIPGIAHSKITRVVFVLYCMWMDVLPSLQFLTVMKCTETTVPSEPLYRTILALPLYPLTLYPLPLTLYPLRKYYICAHILIKMLQVHNILLKLCNLSLILQTAKKIGKNVSVAPSGDCL